jgi:hypothetical protein
MNDKDTSYESQPFKWLVALIVFMLVMGFTTANVSGLNVPPAKYHDSGQGTNDNSDSDGTYESPQDPGDSGDDNPESVPEPGTIILLATGLGAAYAATRKKLK